MLGALTAGVAFAPLLACSDNAATGRKQFVVVPDALLAQLSAQSWAEIKRSVPQSEDSGAKARLTRVGAALADASGLQGVDWEFVVFDSPEVNAFVLPGGKVGFFKGLLDMAGGEGEIAAVMGHEIGHVMARHAAERLSQQLLVQLGVQAAALALSENLGDMADEAAAALGAGLIYGVVLPYSRAHELEADKLGVGLMAKSAFDPKHALTFWQKMTANSESGAQPLAWMSTHPTNEERIAALRALV